MATIPVTEHTRRFACRQLASVTGQACPNEESTVHVISRLGPLAAYAFSLMVVVIHSSPEWTRAQTPGLFALAQPSPKDVAP